MQIIILLSLMITLLAGEPEFARSSWSVALTPAVAAAVTWLIAAGVAGLFTAFNLLAASRIDRAGQIDRRVYRRRTTMLTWLMLTSFGCQVFLLRWPLAVYQVVNLPVISELIIWSPFLAMLLAYWASAYPVDARLRMIDIGRRLALGIPVYSAGGVRPVWSLRQFMAFQMRFHLLLILLPLLAIIAMKVLARQLFMNAAPALERLHLTEAQADGLLGLVLMAAAIGVLAVSPPMLARVFATRPLPDTTLRTKLQAAINRLGVRVRRILLWNTHGMVSNAAVMGPWGRLRYVMLSDALLETLADEQIEGVFGHELGHVVHHHIVYYLLLIVGLLSWAAFLADMLTRVGWLNNIVAAHDWLHVPLGALLTVLLAGMILVAFGWISRRFEWQADLTGAQSIVLGQLADSPLAPAGDVAEPGGEAGNVRPRLDMPPNPAAVEVFLSGLFRIADLNGLDRGHRSWRHGSIAQRGQHLRGLCDPRRFRSFQLTIRAIKLTILALAAGAAGLFVLSM